MLSVGPYHSHVSRMRQTNVQKERKLPMVTIAQGIHMQQRIMDALRRMPPRTVCSERINERKKEKDTQKEMWKANTNASDKAERILLWPQRQAHKPRRVHALPLNLCFDRCACVFSINDGGAGGCKVGSAANK